MGKSTTGKTNPIVHTKAKVSWARGAIFKKQSPFATFSNAIKGMLNEKGPRDPPDIKTMERVDGLALASVMAANPAGAATLDQTKCVELAAVCNVKRNVTHYKRVWNDMPCWFRVKAHAWTFRALPEDGLIAALQRSLGKAEDWVEKTNLDSDDVDMWQQRLQFVTDNRIYEHARKVLIANSTDEMREALEGMKAPPVEKK